MLFVKLFKNIGLLAVTCMALNVLAQQPKQKPVSATSNLQEKKFKVQSLPFDINGMNVQFQYIVKYVIDGDKSDEKVWIMDKKLVDLKRQKVIFNLWIENESIRPIVNLADIANKKYMPEYFNDVNFDGYKDLREECKPCSGSRDNIEFIYLFNRHTRRFKLWRSVMGVNVELDPKNKTVQCYSKQAGGEFNFQEIKFARKGIQLYEKTVSCIFLDEKRPTFKVSYSKYVGKKRTAYKTRVINDEQSQDSSTIIEEMTKW